MLRMGRCERVLGEGEGIQTFCIGGSLTRPSIMISLTLLLVLRREQKGKSVQILDLVGRGFFDGMGGKWL